VDSGHTNFDFIGTFNSGDPCSTTSVVSSNYDKDNQGLAGLRASDVFKTGNTYLTDWFDGRPTDIVLMQMGANDIFAGVSLQNILDGYSAFVTALRNQNANVRVIIALLTPMSSGKCGNPCQTALSALNAEIPNWAAGTNTSTSPISVVDLNTGFDVANTTDGIKPDETGAEWLADRWLAAVSPYVL
jgi:lysophospholipase L1-like esterase